MSPPPRAPFRSRPDPRAEEITPLPEAPPTLAIVRDEQRDLRARIAMLEALRDEEAQSRAKWGARLWDVVKGLLILGLGALLVYASGRVQCAPPPPPKTTPEVHP